MTDREQTEALMPDPTDSSDMSNPTKIVLGTIAVAALLSLALIANLALA